MRCEGLRARCATNPCPNGFEPGQVSGERCVACSVRVHRSIASRIGKAVGSGSIRLRLRLRARPLNTQPPWARSPWQLRGDGRRPSAIWPLPARALRASRSAITKRAARLRAGSRQHVADELFQFVFRVGHRDLRCVCVCVTDVCESAACSLSPRNTWFQSGRGLGSEAGVRGCSCPLSRIAHDPRLSSIAGAREKASSSHVVSGVRNGG